MAKFRHLFSLDIYNMLYLLNSLLAKFGHLFLLDIFNSLILLNFALAKFGHLPGGIFFYPKKERYCYDKISPAGSFT